MKAIHLQRSEREEPARKRAKGSGRFAGNRQLEPERDFPAAEPDFAEIRRRHFRRPWPRPGEGDNYKSGTEQALRCLTRRVRSDTVISRGLLSPALVITLGPFVFFLSQNTKAKSATLEKYKILGNKLLLDEF